MIPTPLVRAGCPASLWGPPWPERGVGEEEHRLRGALGVVWASPCSANWLYTWSMMPHPLWSVSLAVELAAEVSGYLPALCLWEPSDSHIL